MLFLLNLLKNVRFLLPVLGGVTALFGGKLAPRGSVLNNKKYAKPVRWFGWLCLAYAGYKAFFFIKGEFETEASKKKALNDAMQYTGATSAAIRSELVSDLEKQLYDALNSGLFGWFENDEDAKNILNQLANTAEVVYISKLYKERRGKSLKAVVDSVLDVKFSTQVYNWILKTLI